MASLIPYAFEEAYGGGVRRGRDGGVSRRIARGRRWLKRQAARVARQRAKRELSRWGAEG